MTSFLLTALIFTGLLCLALGLLCYRLFTTLESSGARRAAQEREWMQKQKEIDRYLSGILRVLNNNVGGISKRLSESAEIADTIHSNAPGLITQSQGLVYWLHANDQFLLSLYAAAAEGIDRHHQRRVAEMKKCGRQEVFGRIYESAGLPVPSLHNLQARGSEESYV